MVAQIDEQHAAVVADAVAPAGQPHVLADVALAQRAAGMGTVAMHEIPDLSVDLKKRDPPSRICASGVKESKRQ